MTNDLIQPPANVDQNLLLYLNDFHDTFADYFMSTFTGKWVWVPMYASILYVLLKNFNWKVTLCCLAAIAPTIIFADQVYVGLTHPAVERLHPANPENPISGPVHVVSNYRGGRYGFPFCHAPNPFELAFFLVFLFRKQRLSLFVLLWVILNYYTRIYLGIYYPGDLIVGAVIGCCGAALTRYLLKKIAKGTSLGKVKHTKTTIYAGSLIMLGILIYAFIMA